MPRRSSRLPASADPSRPESAPTPPSPIRPFAFSVLESGDGGICLSGVVFAENPEAATALIGRHPALRPRTGPRRVLLQGVRLDGLAQQVAHETAGVVDTTGPWAVRTVPGHESWWPR